MSASPDATMLAEQGPRVLIAQLMQDDPDRRQRVIRGLALNAQMLACEALEAGGA